jgi:hypothetical protein
LLRGHGEFLAEGERPGGLLIEDIGTFVAGADGGIQLLHAALLLRLVAIEAEAIGKPRCAYRGGHGMGC